MNPLPAGYGHRVTISTIRNSSVQTSLQEGPPTTRGSERMTSEKVEKVLPGMLRFADRKGAGLDVHKNSIVACVVIEKNRKVLQQRNQKEEDQHVWIVVNRMTFDQTPEGRDRLCRYLSNNMVQSVLMEATGVYSVPVVEALTEFANWNPVRPEIIVAHPAEVNKFLSSSIHQDRKDAEGLAKISLLGVIRPSYIANGKIRELRFLERNLYTMEKDISRLKARIKQGLAEAKLPFQDLDIDANWGLELLMTLQQTGGDFEKAVEGIRNGTFAVKSSTRQAIENRSGEFDKYEGVVLPFHIIMDLGAKLFQISSIRELMEQYALRMERICNEDEKLKRSVNLLSDCPGITHRSAVRLVGEVGDISRFPNVKKFLMYAGCAPTIHQSGTKSVRGHLNKRVNHFLKTLFFTAGRIVCSVSKSESQLRDQARVLMNRYWTRKKLAFAKVGVKIAKIVYCILKSGEAYSPYPTSPSSRLSSGVQPPLPVELKELKRRAKRLKSYIKKILWLRKEGKIDFPLSSQFVGHMVEGITHLYDSWEDWT